MAPPSGASARYNNPLARIGVYQHHDAQTHVVPLHGAEGNPWPGLGLLTAANLGVFALWNLDESDAHQEWMGRHFTTNVTNLREGRPWTLQVDSFAAAATAHFLLHADYMELDEPTPMTTTTGGGGGGYQPKAPLKRYWQAELWSSLFDTLLNVPAAGPQPDLAALAARIHAHFDGTPRHRAELKHALQRQFAQLSDAGLLRRR